MKLFRPDLAELQEMITLGRCLATPFTHEQYDEMLDNLPNIDTECFLLFSFEYRAKLREVVLKLAPHSLNVDLDYLRDLSERICDLEYGEVRIVMALMETMPEIDIEEALDMRYDVYFLPQIKSYKELGQFHIEQEGVSSKGVDLELLGKDRGCNGHISSLGYLELV